MNQTPHPTQQKEEKQIGRMLYQIQVNITEKSRISFFHVVFNRGTLPLQRSFPASREMQPLWQLQLQQEYSIFYYVCSTATNGVRIGIVSEILTEVSEAKHAGTHNAHVTQERIRDEQRNNTHKYYKYVKVVNQLLQKTTIFRIAPTKNQFMNISFKPTQIKICADFCIQIKPRA